MKKAFRVKPYLHPRLKWVVRGKESGKWVRKFFETKAEAETYADLKHTEFLNLGLEGMSFPTELRVMAQEASRELLPFGKTIRDAKTFYIQHLLGTQKRTLLTDAIERILELKISQGVKPRTMKTYRGCVMTFGSSFTARDIGSITTEEIQSWLLKKFQKPVSRNNNRRILVNLFSIARRLKYIGANPVAEIATAIEPKKEVGILSPSDMARLLKCADLEVLPYFAIAAFAGIRPEELKKPAELALENSELNWSDIKWKQGLIRIRPEVSKVGKARNVAMEPNLKSWLAPYMNNTGKVCTPSWLRLFRKTRRDAEITLWPADCLRHSFATYWLEKYKDAPRLALEMGNSVEVILERYHRVLDEPADAEDFWNILPPPAARH